MASVKWTAPALNTVLYRYSEAEVNNILEYGRPPSPMPAWGSLGGGPLSDQQLLDVIAYLRSIQLPANTATQTLNTEIATRLQARRRQPLHALRHQRQTATGRRSARPCSTWASTTASPAAPTPAPDATPWAGRSACRRCPAAAVALGPNLTNGSELRTFDTPADQQAFVSVGSTLGKGYGHGGMGSGQMPAWGINPNASDPTQATMSPAQTMYTENQIAAIVTYERSL